MYVPVAEGVGGGVAGAFLLLAELGVEAVDVDLKPVFGGDELGQVEGEAVGVVEPEGVGPGDDARGRALLHAVVEQLDAPVEGAQECQLLLADYALYEFLLLCEFRIGLAHVAHELADEPAEERLREAEEGIAVAHGPAQYAAYHIACLDIRGELPVGYAERDCAYVVGDDPHRHVGLLVLAVAVAAYPAYLVEHAGEYVGVVVAPLALEHSAEPLESHSGVDVLGGKGLEVAVSHSLVLHEHEVPYLYHVRVALVD